MAREKARMALRNEWMDEYMEWRLASGKQTGCGWLMEQRGGGMWRVGIGAHPKPTEKLTTGIAQHN